MVKVVKKADYAYEYNFVEEEAEEKDMGFGVRHIQAILLFFVLFFSYCIRVCMSIGIVAMTNPSSENKDIPYFTEWDKKVQNLILSSFFIGYMILQVPAGVLSTKFGGKRLIDLSLLLNGGLCLIVPWAVQTGGWKALVCLRILQGTSQGFIYPSLNTLLGKWAPLNERSRLSNYIYAAAPLSPVIAIPICGYLAASSFGWPSLFYIIGLFTTLTGCLWIYLGVDSPSQHKTITHKERKYIESSLGVFKEQKVKSRDNNFITPWRSIFTSPHFIALSIAHVGCNYIFLTLLLEIPTYIKEVHNIDIKESGLLTALPYLVMWMMSFFCSFLADFFVNRKIMSLTNVRKAYNTIGNLFPAIALLILCILPTDQTVIAISIITITVGCTGANNVGFLMNHVDLSPNFCGIMFGFTNMVANLLSLIAPAVVGFAITDSGDPSEWNLVFFITAGISFTTCLVYLIYGSAEKQPWDELIYSDKSSVEDPSSSEVKLNST